LGGIGLRILLAEGRAVGQRHAAADDGIGAQIASFAPLQVHGATTTMAEALIEPEDLGEGLLDEGMYFVVDGMSRIEVGAAQIVQAFGQELVMAAVGSVDAVSGSQTDDGSNCSSLLTDARMRRAVQGAFAGQLQRDLLE